ncbi:NAD(P)/FAD-dependent oxidoreductase [Larsenimonas rhizosphaerae]|uniref:NAD(P)/FAD-dependent oxidoreductase n=1 Tax=Larsenimonas rhizosphaerae TaxID=2944682 RepID=UPI0020347D52|nr:NAD(P)/FAD-dependent oxidoreductase [Larsenimonas rhizosphaerae]MCM2131731.1 tryptophan 7-halogenase [Larsenimonas rhizosphaerae]
MSELSTTTDVAIIGAGPAGALAAKWLVDRGVRVEVIEARYFPRFSIGESLLPQSMHYLEEAGLLHVLEEGGYQHKNGARFDQDGTSVDIDFRDKFTDGYGTTCQVERADFDHRLIKAAEQAGAVVHFGARISDFTAHTQTPCLTITPDEGPVRHLTARFVIDASGFGRVLARHEGLMRAPGLSERTAVFAHIEDHISDPGYDREKILLGAHASEAERWFWLIPFANGRASLGFVERAHRLTSLGDTPEAQHQALWKSFPYLTELLKDARLVREPATLGGYSADVERLHGPGYVLVGNAGEFLDPIFSSGVTIALRSARDAAALVYRSLQGDNVDWHLEFELPLRQGISVFRAFVDAWYDGSLATIIFHPDPPAYLKRMISAVLAGYAWDTTNPFVAAPRKHLASLAALCKKETA